MKKGGTINQTEKKQEENDSLESGKRKIGKNVKNVLDKTIELKKREILDFAICFHENIYDKEIQYPQEVIDSAEYYVKKEEMRLEKKKQMEEEQQKQIEEANERIRIANERYQNAKVNK